MIETKVRHISTFFEQWAPRATSLDFDNTGLLIGSEEQPAKRILTCLDVTDEVISEAVQKQADIIVAHHPLIFKKLSRIHPGQYEGGLIYRLIQNNIALFVSHTNLDAARNGVSFTLAEQIGLTNCDFLKPDASTSRLLRVYTDEAQRDPVVRSLEQHQARQVRVSPAYRESTAHVQAQLHPTGDQKESEAGEKAVLIEARVNQHRLSELYREIGSHGSIQVLPLEQGGVDHGFGVIGMLEQPMQRNAFLEHLGSKLDSDTLRYSGMGERIQNVAVCGGAGIFLISDAVSAGADAFVTADVKYHEFFLEHQYFLLVDVGHYESEVMITETMKRELAKAFPDIAVFATEVNTNPIKTIKSP